MDVLSHGLAGALVAHGTGDRDRVLTAACVGVALLPDLDGVVGLGGRELYFTQHRVLLHSLPAVALVTALCAFAFSRWRGERFAHIWGLFAAAALTHVLLDGVTSWGTVLFDPFWERRFYFDLLFMFDLLLTGLLVTTAVLAWRLPRQRTRVARGGLVAAAIYLVLCAVAGASVRSRVGGEREATVQAVPQPWTPLSWAVFVPDGSGTWAGTTTVFDADTELEHYPAPDSDPAFARANETEAVRRFLTFARFAWVEVEQSPSGRRLHYRDLRFEFSGMERSNWFYGVTVELDDAGRVVAAGFTNPP